MSKAMFNGGEEGKVQLEGGGHDKEVASSKFNTSTVNDLINAHSQTNAPYLIDAPLEVYSLY